MKRYILSALIGVIIGYILLLFVLNIVFIVKLALCIFALRCIFSEF